MKDTLFNQYTKEHYNLSEMHAHARLDGPEWPILHDWYNGLIGEQTAVNRLRALGLIKTDKFVEVVAYRLGNSYGPYGWIKQHKGELNKWQKR